MIKTSESKWILSVENIHRFCLKHIYDKLEIFMTSELKYKYKWILVLLKNKPGWQYLLGEIFVKCLLVLQIYNQLYISRGSMWQMTV